MVLAEHHWTPPIIAEGWPGMRLMRSEVSPFWRRMDALVVRWAIASLSFCPVCLANALPSFRNCSTAEGCQPPKDCATIGIKAIPCCV